MDWDEAHLETCLREMFGGDMLALTRKYFADAAAMAERKPTILGHLDLVVKLNRGGRFFDEEDPAYRSLALEALHAADPDATLLEINTGAMARGYRTRLIRAPFLLREWRAMAGGHPDRRRPQRAAVTYAYDRAAELAGPPATGNTHF